MVLDVSAKLDLDRLEISLDGELLQEDVDPEEGFTWDTPLTPLGEPEEDQPSVEEPVDQYLPPDPELRITLGPRTHRQNSDRAR